ncbi:MAG: phage tail protein [Alphaproteobacteria bacterium]|nr:phage tail protein [Alphaproteobacteria bacterium]
MRAGLQLVDKGFEDVWGAGSASARYPLLAAHFTPYGEGLINYTGNAAPRFSTLYACALYLVDKRLVKGEPYIVSQGYTQSTGSNQQILFKQTRELEWTLFYITALDAAMFSFEPSESGAVITRPWFQFKSDEIIVASTTQAAVTSSRIILLHRPTINPCFRITDIRLAQGGFIVESDGKKIEGDMKESNHFNIAVLDSARFIIVGHFDSDGRVHQLEIVRRKRTGDALAYIVAAILESAGYEKNQYDLEDLDEALIEGYAIERQMSTEQALEPLQRTIPFDLVENAGRLVAQTQDSGAVVTLDERFAQAGHEGEDSASAQTVRARAQQLDLPASLALDYIDATFDYETGSQCARRLVTQGARSCEKMSLPVVCTSTQAKRIADYHLYALWHQRDLYTLTLARRWLKLNAGDKINRQGRTLKIAAMKQEKGVLTLKAYPALPDRFSSVAEAFAGFARRRAAEGRLWQAAPLISVVNPDRGGRA